MNIRFSIVVPLLILFLGIDIEARSFRVFEIPNGTIFSCTACHNDASGGGALNLFGQDIAADYMDQLGEEGHVLWAELAQLDSDGDRFSNGAELQDADGVWFTGDANPGDTEKITHPGDSNSHPAYHINISNEQENGDILTNSEGFSMYYYTLDVYGSSVCTGSCMSDWQKFFRGPLVLGDGLKEEDFGVSEGADQSLQNTFRGWPIYTYFDDLNPGDLNGQAKDKNWYVLRPDYSIMLADNQLVGEDGISYNSLYEPGEELVQYLTDRDGVTLYTYSKDSHNKNNYTAADFSNNALWPIFYTDIDAVPEGIDAGDFSFVDVFGHLQLSYRGWPLYYFGGDSLMRGNTRGVSYTLPGEWPVLRADIASGIESPASYKDPALLEQNYPNPFFGTTTISFTLLKPSSVSLKVYSMNGWLVQVLLDEDKNSGTYSFRFEGRDMNGHQVPPGIYSYMLSLDDVVYVKRMVLFK